MAHPTDPHLDDDPLWYKHAVIYQLHVRSFFDADGDGVGDFKGLTAKLDYLQDLGVTALWLLPFYPSPLRDDGYDIADYNGVNPTYGTLRDARRFIQEAHRRGLRVVTELVINHTSDEHPWFQRARKAPEGSKWRDFYVWSKTRKRYQDARIIFKDFESSNWTWDSVAGAYYWHRFYHHQPDLNFDNPKVHDAVIKAMEFWFDAGVDGLRLDAIPYLYEREGTTCENLPETHAFLKKLRAHVDRKYPGRMLLAEANQWPEDTLDYFGDGDECHMAFHFPVMPRMYMAVHQEDRFPLIDILQQTPPIPDNSQWALFLRNHDELTLEMVTDEERDYMYRVYAAEPRARINLGIRRRLAPLLDNNRRKIELLNGLLFSLPGTPIIYYGDELGMGDNIYLGDRDGVRTPMQWNADRNAGFSKANPHKLFLPVNIDPEYRYESVNVAAQEDNASSLLWWMKRLIALRQNHKVFGHGTLEFLLPDNPKILAFIREDEDETVLVVANLSRFVQYAELDLERYAGRTPVELFGKIRFPRVGELPYFLTLAPHGFYWLTLERPDERSEDELARLPTVTVQGGFPQLFEGRGRAALEAALPAALVDRRWFGGKARIIQSVKVEETVPVPRAGRDDAWLVFVRVTYTEGEPETYLMPMAFAPEPHDEQLLRDLPQAALLRLVPKGSAGVGGVIFEASVDERFGASLLRQIQRRQRLRGGSGEIVGQQNRPFRSLMADAGDLTAVPSRAEQSNTSVVYGEHFILKLFRRVHPGLNPDYEIGRFLTEAARFPHTPRVAGALEYRTAKGEPSTLAILQELVPNEGDAWRAVLTHLGSYYEEALSHGGVLREAPPPPDPFAVEKVVPPDEVYDRIGAYLQTVELLGQRTAQMHLALGIDTEDKAFGREPFTPHYQRSLYQSIRNQTRQALSLLRKRRSRLPAEAAELASQALEREAALLRQVSRIKDQRIEALRIRTHGDYHLGQVLWTGRDFAIIDFEGEPARSLTERRLRRSPLRDVAGMLRSFQYAAQTSLQEQVQRFGLHAESESLARLDAAARTWQSWMQASFLRAYLDVAGELLPEGSDASRVLLESYLLEKAAYELAYELNNRPLWVSVPLKGILDLTIDEA